MNLYRVIGCMNTNSLYRSYDSGRRVLWYSTGNVLPNMGTIKNVVDDQEERMPLDTQSPTTTVKIRVSDAGLY